AWAVLGCGNMQSTGRYGQALAPQHRSARTWLRTSSIMAPHRAHRVEYLTVSGNANQASLTDSVKPTGVGSTSRPSPVRPSSPVPRDGSRCGAAVKGRLRPSPLDGAPPHRLLDA